MFYFLFELLYNEESAFRFLRIFKYITIRTGGAFVTALLIFLIFGNGMLKFLRKRKFGDKVKDYFEGKRDSKEGTPTMGGIFIYFVTMVTVLLWGNLSNPYILVFILGTTLSFAVGFLDDLVKLKNGNGISARVKFLLLTVSAVIVAFCLNMIPSFETTVLIPIFKDVRIQLGIYYYLFMVIVLLATSNAVNLSDGMDGLAASLSMISFFTLALIAYFTGNAIYSGYLNIPFIADIGELTVFAGAIVGVCLGFLWYNFYPAQVFMGDSGSLQLGFSMGLMSVMVKQELLLLIFGGIFLMETLSVIIQVSGFKLFGKRAFKMAPLHHHYEKRNIPESKVVIRFVIISIVLSIIALATIKVR